MPKVKIGDINMFYEIYGVGEPLILIGGLGSELTVWETIAEELSNFYQVISFDNRGAGRTDKPDGHYTTEIMAEDTIGLMNELGIKNAHILGISMGSHIAQVMAVKYPERVNKLILNVATSSYPELLKPIPDAQVLEDAEVMFTQQRYPPTPESFLNQLQAVKNFDGRNQLNQIKSPTLIINARDDPLAPMECTDDLISGIKYAKLVLVGGDHFFALMEPELLTSPVFKFLED